MKTKEAKKLEAINKKEIKNSTQNLSVIVPAIDKLSAQMRLLSHKLSERYEEGDRRADAIDEAITRLDTEIFALETLKTYEKETITLCLSKC